MYLPCGRLAPVSYKRLFSRFLQAAPDRTHFAAHSHHYWPDVTFDAQMRAWQDAALLADRKWEKVFGEVIPAAQSHVARILKLPNPTTITFAPNTHEILVRVLSSLPVGRSHRVLTTDGEFHSFSRQMQRLEEDGLAEVTRVPCRPLATFVERWRAAAKTGNYDLAYVSHVFFDSGFAIANLHDLVSAIENSNTVIVIDGYHGFCALPTDLSSIADRVLYVSGGYKYAMSGEGACFVHVPDGWVERPRITGWFAAFGALEGKRQSTVPYAQGGARLMGATFDPSGLYRFVAAMDMLVQEKIDVSTIHAHVQRLQTRFAGAMPSLRPRLVVPITEPNRGHFLTYELPEAGAIHTRLLEANVVTDVRGDRLRFGFGLYHDDEDIDGGVERINHALAE
jgi:kynureninase